jgi:hypothetical protein
MPREKEANFRLLVVAWNDLMDLYYPNAAWLGLPKDLFDFLKPFKNRRRLPTYERAVEKLLLAMEVGRHEPDIDRPRGECSSV